MAKKAKQLITTIGQLMDAIVKDRATIVSVPGGQISNLDALIRRCYRYYRTVPRDGALLRAIDDVAEHRGCLTHLVRRMTLEEFNAALDEVFAPPTPPADFPAAQKELSGLGCKPRDEWFLARYEEANSATFHKPAIILKKWAALPATARAEICPDVPGKGLTVDAVRKAIQRASNRAKAASG